MPPPSRTDELLAKVLFRTVRVPTPFSSAKPPPLPPEKLLDTVLALMGTLPVPALPTPPPKLTALVLLWSISDPVMTRLALRNVLLTVVLAAAPLPPPPVNMIVGAEV